MYFSHHMNTLTQNYLTLKGDQAMFTPAMIILSMVAYARLNDTLSLISKHAVTPVRYNLSLAHS